MWVVADVPPVLSTVVHELPVLELCLGLTQSLFLLGCLIELVLGVGNDWQLRCVLFLVTILQIIQDRVNVLTLYPSRFVLFNLVHLPKQIRLVGVVEAGLPELVLCGSEFINPFVLPLCVQLDSCWLLSKNCEFFRCLPIAHCHSLEVLVLQYLCSSWPLPRRVLQHGLNQI